METFASEHVLALFLALGTILLATRLAGALVRRLGQPAVLGEIAAGIALGPTVLGRALPEVADYLFPSTGLVAGAFQALMMLSVTLFLLAAGMEVDLSAVLRRGRTMAGAAAGGIAVPFAVGYCTALPAPAWFGMGERISPSIFPLFLATALSISALPVIAKTLMDLHLYRSDLGVIVIGAAVLNDLAGWIFFAVVLAAGASENPMLGIGATIGLTVLFTVAMLTVVRWGVHRILPLVITHASRPSGVLAFALSLALFSAAFTTFAGVHALLGAFLAGVVLGDSSHLREQTRQTISDFVSYFFAPLFFGGIGLSVDFAANFSFPLCAVVLTVACLGKIVGGGLGAVWGGAGAREAWAIGVGLNARGSMEIILGLTALQAGLIRETLFVALVVMALVTSLITAPILSRLMRHARQRRLIDHLTQQTFLPELRARDRKGAIAELTSAAFNRNPDAARAEALAWTREQAGATGIGGGVAIPHARVPGLAAPRVALGLSSRGIDFDALDGEPARIIVLVFSPFEEPGTQLELLGSIGTALRDDRTREAVLRARSWPEISSALQG